MSLWAVLLTGLFAGGASCAAVQGGLLARLVACRTGQPNPGAATGTNRPKPRSASQATTQGKAKAGRPPRRRPATPVEA